MFLLDIYFIDNSETNYFRFFNYLCRTLNHNICFLKHTQGRFMFNIKAIAISFVLILSACSSDRMPIKGTDGNDIPPAFANFSGIPIPDPAYVNLEETRALGYGENWSGTLIFTTPYPSYEVFDFYISEMPKFGWSDVATVRGRISHMTYIKDKKAIQILVEKDGDSKAYVTITAIPNNTGISGIK